MRSERGTKDESDWRVIGAIVGALFFAGGMGIIMGMLVAPPTFAPAGFLVGAIAGLLVYVALWILLYYGRPTLNA